MKGVVAVCLVGSMIGYSAGTLATQTSAQTDRAKFAVIGKQLAARSGVCPRRGKAVVIYLSRYKWYACRNGRIIKSGRASGGKNYCSDVGRSCRTPRGHFKVVRKGGKNCRSSKYPLGKGGAWMGYCVFFSKYYAIHASHNVPYKRHASHGCVRVKPHAAKWLNRSFLNYGDRVIVK